MINVLFIAIEFAPVSTTGNFRSLKFVKYFRDFGINPIVITLDVDSASRIFAYAKVDYTLLEDLPEGTNIYRIPCGDLSKYYTNNIRRFLTIYFSTKDKIAEAWEKGVMNNIQGIIDKHKPEAILATLPPFSTGSLAVNISKTFNLPLIIDMRDGWSKWCLAPYGSWLHYYFTYREEKKLFKRADVITTVTDQLADIFRDSHNEINSDKFKVVTNGYDENLSFEDKIEVQAYQENKEYVIGYTGAFYYYPKGRRDMMLPWWKKRFHRIFQYSPVKEDWLYRSPYYFFKAVRMVLDNNPRINIKIKFIGEKPDWLEPMAAEFSLLENCQFGGVMPRNQMLKVQRSFDAFLCTSVKVIGGYDYVLASKTFDYLLLHKPMIGFVTEGAQREFIQGSGIGFICDPDNISESAQILEKIILGNYTMTPNIKFLSKFSRLKTAEKLAGLLKSVVR